MRKGIILIVFFMLILSGCSKEVENETVNIIYGDKEIIGQFTGTLTDKMATGEGEFVANEENGGWKYEGAFENNEIKGVGNLSNYKYEIIIQENVVEVIYDGESLNGIPNGEGKILGKIDGLDFEYEGTFENGNLSGSGIVNKFPHKIVYENNEILGEYSGKTIDGLPNGEGIFNNTSDEIVFNYDGEWENGKLKGKGILTTSHYTIDFTQVVRTGSYQGSVKDGLASGEGKYTAFTDNGEEYVYTGTFENGVFHGYGIREFTDKELNYPSYEGTYTNGEYTPTKSEFLKYLGQVPDFINYTVADESAKFIDEHEELFLAESKDLLKELHNNSITMDELYKRPYEYLETIVSISKCKVIQILEESSFEDKFTWFICNDSKNNRVFVVADSELPNVNKNSRVRVYGLPIGFASYKNGFGADTTAYVIYASYIE